MQHLGSIGEWMLFECSETAGEMLRVAYNLQTGAWYHVCSSLDFRWDPDPMIPQDVINIHLNSIVRKGSK